jgi:membrane-bound lytic murein transglycosylase A
MLQGSRKRSERARYPLYGVPDDLLVVELGELYPELKGMRLRGRLEGRKVVPYYSRAEIESGKAAFAGKELAWVEDPVELFFLQIQGSGRVRLADGSFVRVGYADQNGHPYKAIGKVFIERGELPANKVSMQSIQGWARDNPAKLPELLNSNPSYVFFRELPAGVDGPPGAQGLPLTPGGSIAVDPKHLPLGTPVLLATTQPGNGAPLNKLVVAQDTGGAIRGPLRADFFWGYGADAGKLAGAMKQSGRMWVLWPAGMEPPASAENGM